MFRILLVTILLFSVVRPGYSQGTDSLFSFVTAIKGDIQSFATDNLDNIYIVTSTGQLKKINAKGDSVAVFNDIKKYGKLNSIDVSNPLKILLYYKDFSTIVVLDRFLNLRHAIDLRKSGMFQVSAIGQSYDGQVWLFDALNYRLVKINDEGKPLFETPDFRQLFKEAPQPLFIFDQDGYVYLYDTTRGFYIFDYYGTLKKTLPIGSLQHISISGKMIYAIKAGNLQQIELNNFSVREYPVPAHFSPYNSLRLMGEKLYLLNEGYIKVYSVVKN